MIQVLNSDGNFKDKYHLFIGVLGYESRSSYIAEKISNKCEHKLAFTYTDNQVLKYKDNERTFTELGFNIISASYSDLSHSLETNMKKISSDGIINILIDISSMPRTLSAQLIYYFLNYKKSSINLTISYSLSKYYEPVHETAVVSRGPVIPEFSGWTLRSGAKRTLLMGLGYEYERAFGMVEYIEPSDVWLFIPQGADHEFDERVFKENKSLINFIGEEKLIKYNPLDPYPLYLNLSHLAYGAAKSIGNLYFMPFGPKVFHAISLLVAQSIGAQCSVWRVSGGHHSIPNNTQASGKVALIEVVLNASSGS